MSGSPLLSLFDLYARQSTFSFSDYEREEFPGYADKLTGPISLEKNLPELFFGIQADRSATITLSNVNASINTAGSEYGTTNGELDGYGDNPYGGSNSDPTISEITKGEDIRGRKATARLIDLDTGSTVLTLTGTIRSISKSPETATVNISSQDQEMFNELIPKKRILDIQPQADLTNVQDQDARVITAFGGSRKVSLAQVYKFTPSYAGSVYEYGLIRKPAAGSAWLDTVYRGGRVVSPTEYAFAENPTGYHVVRFTQDQRDFSGSLMPIQVDIESSEFTRPSAAVNYIINEELRGTVLPSSLTAANAAYAALSMQVMGALTAARPASDVINQLLLYGAVLDKGSDGNYTITVDGASQHAAGTPSLGLGDGQWENIIGDPIEEQKTIEERLRALTINGLFDNGFSGSGTYLLKATRSRSESGIEQDESNPFIGDATTLDTEVDYRFKRMKFADRTITLDAALETKALSLGNLVGLYIPDLCYNGDLFEIRGMGFKGGRGEPGQTSAASFALKLGGYNSSAFTYVAGTVQAAPSANAVTDYSLTPPGAVTGFAVTSSTSNTTGTNQIEAVINLQATAPSFNVTHLVFQVFKPGTGLPFGEVIRPINAGGTAFASFVVAPKTTYYLLCFARNVGNTANAQDGIASILTQQSSNIPGAPDDPPAVAAAQGTGLTVGLSWTANTEQNIGGYQVYRRLTTNSPGGSTLIATVGGNHPTYTDTDPTLVYGSTYYYWVKAFNTSYPANASQRSGFSTNMSVGITLTAIGDQITAGTITLTGGTGPALVITDDNAIRIHYDVFAKIKWTNGATVVFDVGAGSAGGFSGFQIEPTGADNTYDIRLGTGAKRAVNVSFYAAGLWDFEGGGWMFIDETGSAPGSNPSSGVYLYADPNGLWARTQSGNVVQFAPGNPSTVSGAKGGNAALGSLLTILAGYGIIIDSSGA